MTFKQLAEWQDELRSAVAAAAPPERADVFVKFCFGDGPPSIAARPDEAARAAENVRLEFAIDAKDVDAAMRRLGIPVDAIDRLVDEQIEAGEIQILS
jgi:hypothetical protein